VPAYIIEGEIKNISRIIANAKITDFLTIFSNYIQFFIYIIIIKHIHDNTMSNISQTYIGIMQIFLLKFYLLTGYMSKARRR
jgi:hypothetical protein